MSTHTKHPIAAAHLIIRAPPFRVRGDKLDGAMQLLEISIRLIAVPAIGRVVPDLLEVFARAGFSDVYNISDGMEGDLVTDTNSVFLGQRMVNGWKNSELPWTYDVDPKRMVLPPSSGQ